MTIHKINPGDLHEPEGYVHVAVAEGTRRVYVAGQVGVDTRDQVVGDDLASQTSQALENLRIALDAAGAGWEHVVKLTFYIVGYDVSMMDAFGAGMGNAVEQGMTPTAATLVGVQALYRPDLLIEIEAIAEI